MLRLVQVAQGIASLRQVDREECPPAAPPQKPNVPMPLEAERAHAFGARVRAIRRSKKLTQREVAARLPMSPGNLSRLENGEHGPPADEVIAKLATALDTDAAELFRLAGRDVGGASFERQVLSELQRLRRELRSGFDRLDAAIAASRTAKQRS